MNTPHPYHPNKPRLLDQVREIIRVKRDSPDWARTGMVGDYKCGLQPTVPNPE